MKVLLSAFSCEPWRGSEPEVGFRTMLAAAEQHDVWVLTSATGVPALTRYLDGDPLAPKIHLVPHPAVAPGDDEGRLGLLAFHRMYDRWQRQVAAIALELDRRVGFDLVHHVTIATVWTRAGAALIEKPLVWGPVGGGVHPPLKLTRELGWRGLGEDVVRVLGRRALARLPHARAAPRRAVVALAQNSLTATVMRTRAPITVLSNGTAVDVSHVPLPRQRTADLVFVGRLVPWKGTMLALRAFRQVSDPGARLRFFGQGPDRERLERAAVRWGLADRVFFEGWRPRDAVLAEVAAAAALVHPSLHDESGLCVAEALSLGTPAICLDHGGPAEVVRHWPHAPGHLVQPGLPRPTADRLATVMTRCVKERMPVPELLKPDSLFPRTIQAAYEAAAAASPQLFSPPPVRRRASSPEGPAP